MKHRVAKLDPLKPSRADYRLIRKLMDSSFGGKVEHMQEDYELILRVFQKAGGSWEMIFLGSSKNVALLKKVLRVAFKNGHLTKASQWE